MEEQSTSYKLEDEPEIVERAKTDDQAFEVLYNYYFPKMYGYLFKRTGNHEVAEDLVSATFMKVFCNLKNYKHQGCTFGAWVYKIATNNLIDHYRKEGRKQEIDIDLIQEPEDTNPTPEDLAQNTQNRKLIKVVLEKLSVRHQEILHLKFFAEMSNNEIAEVMGISVNNTRVLTYRALKNFHKLYKKYEK